ncbi:MAG: NAD-dependent epimerase/dehydratase family protein [Candidatus Helarchaeota archaeon]
MRILVTGATGFIGSHLVDQLLERNHEVFALERYITGRYVLGKKRDFLTVFGDLRNYFTIRNIIKEVQPEVVFHLAAISPVSYSYDHPNEVLDVNLTGTVNLAEACLREIPAFKHFLFASTSETFGNGPLPKKEDTPQFPNSPYSVSKFGAEKYLLYMKDAYNFPVTILRPFNTYGRKNNSHFVVERIITQMLLQKDEVRLGDPNPVRDLLYVDDHVNAYLTCFENPDTSIGEIFNFCTGVGTKISDLVEKIKSFTNYEGKIYWNTIPARPLDILKLIGDYSKAKKVLGWKPRYSLDEGLKLTIDYWKKKLVK